MGQKAMSAGAKEAKRQSILKTAWELLDHKASGLPSMNQIAKASGLGKGTLYLYFDTREEIFANLLQQSLDEWMQFIESCCDQEQITIGSLAKQTVAFIEGREKFMRLAVSSYSILEQNLTVEAASTYKSHLSEVMARVGEKIESRFNQVGKGAGPNMLLDGYGVILGMWCVAMPPDAIQSAIKSIQAKVFEVDFFDKTSDMLTRLWESGYN